MTSTPIMNRRAHERFRLAPMYTDVVARCCDEQNAGAIGGHAYDISEGGMRLELDQRFTPGRRLDLAVTLPGTDEPLHFTGEVVWRHDADDDPGPCRMAVRIVAFATDRDRIRLLRYLGAGHLYRAA